MFRQLLPSPLGDIRLLSLEYSGRHVSFLPIFVRFPCRAAFHHPRSSEIQKEAVPFLSSTPGREAMESLFWCPKPSPRTTVSVLASAPVGRMAFLLNCGDDGNGEVPRRK